MSGIRIAVGSSWRVLIAAEMVVGSGERIGYAIIQSRWTMDYVSAFVCITLIGLGLERLLFRPLESHTIRRWRGGSHMSAQSFDTTCNTAQIHIRNLRVFFPDPSGRGRREALCIERLDICMGEFLAITGPSGSGKSTLINLVAGFLAPNEGQILKDGQPIAGSGPDRIVVFQNHALFPWLTAFENVTYGLKRLPLSRAELDSRVREALAVTGLGEFASASPSTLSGGMCQHVALARARRFSP